MLIFQINQNELNGELNSKDWLFWNAYLSQRVKDNDYCLLPAFIDYIQDTDQPIDTNGQFFVELEDEDT
jgi:hypothetical protein